MTTRRRQPSAPRVARSSPSSKMSPDSGTRPPASNMANVDFAAPGRAFEQEPFAGPDPRLDPVEDRRTAIVIAEDQGADVEQGRPAPVVLAGRGWCRGRRGGKSRVSDRLGRRAAARQKGWRPLPGHRRRRQSFQALDQVLELAR